MNLLIRKSDFAYSIYKQLNLIDRIRYSFGKLSFQAMWSGNLVVTNWRRTEGILE